MAKKQKSLDGLNAFLKEKAKELSKNKTKWETSLYTTLKDLHYKFKFQVPVICAEKHGYILDFLLTDYNLVIEVDSVKYHTSPQQRKKDNLRTRRLKKEGFHLIRLMNSQISKYSAQDIDNIIKSKIMLIDLEKSKK